MSTTSPRKNEARADAYNALRSYALPVAHAFEPHPLRILPPLCAFINLAPIPSTMIRNPNNNNKPCPRTFPEQKTGNATEYSLTLSVCTKKRKLLFSRAIHPFSISKHFFYRRQATIGSYVLFAGREIAATSGSLASE